MMEPVQYKTKLDFGKIEVEGRSGERRVTINVELRGQNKYNLPLHKVKELELSLMGDIFGDSGGQNYDELLAAFPYSPLMHEIVGVWKRWHLNKLKAGDPTQEAWLRKHGHGKDYDETCAKLEAAGLLVHDGYKYGSEWKFEELPPYIIKQVTSWEKHPELQQYR